MRKVNVPFALLMALLLCTGVMPASVAQAQVETLCFSETNRCISGPFLRYWRSNGGVPVFGFPITAARPERNRDTQAVYLTQWFQRNRFELHGDQVLLGRLGDDRLVQLGIDWRTLPGDDAPLGDCRPFAATGQRLCNQGEAFGFKQYWESHGLDLGDPGVSYRESLALFGLPLTRVREELNADGDTVQTQWFERARFEWHPGKPDEFKVLLGLLGRDIGPPVIAPRTTPQGRTCPDTHPIKGNINRQGERIYHVPGSRYYDETLPESCFSTEEDAQAAGYRPPQR